MTSFGKFIREENKKGNENQIDEFYSTPTADEVESLMKQAAAEQSAQHVITPKTKERS